MKKNILILAVIILVVLIFHFYYSVTASASNQKAPAKVFQVISVAPDPQIATATPEVASVAKAIPTKTKAMPAQIKATPAKTQATKATKAAKATKAKAVKGQTVTSLRWTPAAQKALGSLASFDYSYTIRNAVIRKIENYARKQGIRIITPAVINAMTAAGI